MPTCYLVHYNHQTLKMNIFLFKSILKDHASIITDTHVVTDAADLILLRGILTK